MATGGFQSLAYAQQFRDIIRELVAKELKTLRPQPRLATVDSFDRTTGTCNVIFAGDTDPVPVKMYSIQPTTGGGVGVGDVVRVEGAAPRRHVTEVVKGNRFIQAGQLAASVMQTTASAANMFIDATTGIIYRSTSSLKYKKNIQELDVSASMVMDLQAVTYEAKDSDSGATHLGLIAEQIADLDDPILNQLLVYDADGNPDAVQYDRLAVLLLPVIQRLITRVQQLEWALEEKTK